jgi:uncharacterized membrane protein (UPF0136 family)
MSLSETLEDSVILEKSSKLVSDSFQSDFFRLISLLIAGVFAGYTLQPVPKWLNDQFDNNIILKFVVLVVIGITALYPIDNKKFLYIILTSIITLALFEFLRKFDKKEPPKEEPKLDSEKK